MQMFYFIEKQHCQRGRSDNSEARFFCTTQLLKENSPFRSFLSSISPYRYIQMFYFFEKQHCQRGRSDNNEARFFCTTQLLKENSPFRSFLSSISAYRTHHSLIWFCSFSNVTSCCYSINKDIKKKATQLASPKRALIKKKNVNLVIKKIHKKWVCVNAVNNAKNRQHLFPHFANKNYVA